MTNSKLLRLAAEAITPDNWCQGIAAHAQPHRPACAVVRLGRTATQHNVPLRWAEIIKAFNVHFGTGMSDWNDKPGRTANEVKEAFLYLADALEKDEK